MKTRPANRTATKRKESRRARRRIPRSPPERNYFLVDACFLANKFLPINLVSQPEERQQVEECQKWWAEIDRQVNAHKAQVFVPDLCIAEAFRVLAKKYYNNVFNSSAQYRYWRTKLRRYVQLMPDEARKSIRYISCHDIDTNRDIIISVDRFFEPYFKAKKKVQTVDLLLLAVGKYLMDFYGFTRDTLYIVTIDRPLWQGAKRLPDIPVVFNPTQKTDRFAKTFQ